MDNSVPTAQAAQPQEKEEVAWWRKALRMGAYPFSILAGMWTVNREVHEATYQNLKRYGAFDDLLNKGEGGGLKLRNERNVQERIAGKISVEDFLERSVQTKNEYGRGLTQRMDHMGLGKDYANFPKKWNYMNRAGRSEALIKGATVTGISLAAILTVAQSKSLLDLLGMEENQSNERQK